MRKILLAFALAMLMNPLAANAADKNPICTNTTEISNRTTITGSPCVLPRSTSGTEVGYTNLTIDGLGNVTVDPQVNLRVGTFTKKVEVDLTLPSYVRSFKNRGTSDFIFGGKYAFYNTKRYALATRTSVEFPTAINGNGASAWSYAGGVVGSYVASPALRLSASSDFQSTATAFNRYGASREALAADLDVYKATHLTGGYGLQTNALGPNTNSRPTYQVGVTQGFGRKASADFALGRDFKKATGQDRYLSVGFTYLP